MAAEPREPAWVQAARYTAAGAAAGGVLACWYVAVVLWQDWEGSPSRPAYVLELAAFTLASAAIVAASLLAPRPVGLALSFLLLVWGWLGTWAYGFLWVPGAVALLSCALPRPPPRVSASAAAPAA